ncbi:MAG: pilus assembly protein [Anaerolineaceae bacterium]|nr:pilus assembly protein [Anaerolineaceae bacterium]
MAVQIQRTKSERGQSLLELAVSLTLLLLMLAGLVDLGRLFMNLMALRDAVQEGALYGAMYPTHCDQIVERTYETAGGSLSSLRDTDVHVYICAWDDPMCNTSCADAGADAACAGGEIRVVIRQPEFAVTMPFIGAFIGQTIPLQSEVTNTILRPSCDGD